MKKVIKLILLIILFNFVIINANAASNSYLKYYILNGRKIVDCTWYAWQQTENNIGIEILLCNNIETWYNKVSKAKYCVVNGIEKSRMCLV